MTLFITVDDVKNNTVIQKNLQTDMVEPYITISQQMYILRILATPLYNLLTNDISANTITGVTVAHAALLEKIKPALVYATAYEYVPFAPVRITNKGMETKGSQETNSKTADQQRIEKVQGKFKEYMEFYLDELTRFLRTNSTLYPSWREEYFRNYEVTSGATYSNTSNRFGLVFDKRLRNDLLGG